MNTWRCMAFFTVCALMVRWSTWRRRPQFCRGDLWNQNHTRGSPLSSPPAPYVPHWARLYLPPPPPLPQISLLFLLLLLLELLDGIHLIPGAHLAHGGRVLALHHQLVGHLVFLWTKQTGEMETKSLLCWIKWVKMKPLWVQRLQNPSSSTSKVSN